MWHPWGVRKPVTLVTGAGGEIGHGLLAALAGSGTVIVTLDLSPLDPALAPLVAREFTGSITDASLLERILAEFEVDLIFHLAALLSTRSEFAPLTAHRVNVEGTLQLLEFAQKEGESHGRPVVFVYPSSIAAYGVPDAGTKAAAGRVREDEWLQPITMYGCNKLACEQMGRYYARHYKQLSAEAGVPHVDFRAVRLPGLLSAATLPAGGTSDYAPEMVHAAARGEPYTCFVGPETRIPFLAMPDAVEALVALSVARRDRLTRTAYNAGGFSVTAGAIRDVTQQAFPDAAITFGVDVKRQRIVDSWPSEVDDSAARADWGFAPRFDFDNAFSEYLIPTIRQRYAR